MAISQFDYQMYLDEIAELRENMTQLLLSMELYQQTKSEAEFNRWWYGSGGTDDYGNDCAGNGGTDDYRNDYAGNGGTGGHRNECAGDGGTGGGSNECDIGGDGLKTGSMTLYFAMKRRIEQIEGFLSRAQVEEQEHPKMRRKVTGDGSQGDRGRFSR